MFSTGGQGRGGQGERKQTQQQLSAVSSVDTPPIHTHTHTQINTHCCVYLVPCVDYFWKSFHFMMSARDRVIITKHTTQKLKRNVYKDVCKYVCVCHIWRPYNNQHLSRLDALLN